MDFSVQLIILVVIPKYLIFLTFCEIFCSLQSKIVLFSPLVHDNILTETRTTEPTRIELHTEEHEEKNDIPSINGGIECK